METIINNIHVTDRRKYPKLYLRPACLYYLRLEFPTGQVLYKLGYTTTTLNERVFGCPATVSYKYNSNLKRKLRVYKAGHNGYGLPSGTQVFEIATYYHRNGSYIYQLEQELHRRYTTASYKGINLMANGNTELYPTDILNLDY